MSAEAKCKTSLRQYLADLATQVCGNDVELVAECIIKWNDFLKNPQETVERICKKSVRHNGKDFYCSLTKDEMNRRIWTAQVRNIFPNLENYRISFIEKHKNDIGRLHTGSETVELGKLYYYVMDSKLIVSTDEKDELKVYYEARNKIAHISIITFDMVKTVLTI